MKRVAVDASRGIQKNRKRRETGWAEWKVEGDKEEGPSSGGMLTFNVPLSLWLEYKCVLLFFLAEKENRKRNLIRV